MDMHQFAPDKLPEVFGGSRLYQDYLWNFDRLKSFYSSAYDLEAIKTRMQENSSRSYDRDGLASLLLQQATQFSSNENVLNAIQSLRDEKTFVVITGQQAGLLGGPLYTIYKAIQVVNLAKELTATTDFNVVPMFWIAAEDHDLAEIDHVHVLNDAGVLKKIQATLGPDGYPAQAATLQDDPAKFVQALVDEFAPSDFSKDIQIRAQLALTAPMADAFRKWMMYLFRDTSMVFVDPYVLRSLSKDVLMKELENPGQHSQLLRQQGDAMQAASYDLPLNMMGDCNLFLFVDGKRCRLDWDGKQYYLPKTEQRFSRDELLELCQQDCNSFSMNVALRPVMQEWILPNAATILGPSEIAYFGQIKPVFESYGIKQPVIVPRNNVTLIDRKTMRKMKKCNVDMSFLSNKDEVRKELLKAPVDSVSHQAELLKDDVNKQLKDLRDMLLGLNDSLDNWSQKLNRKMLKDLQRLVNKINAEDDRLTRNLRPDLDYLLNNLYPHDKPQERVLNIVQFLLKYGPDFVSELMEVLDSHCKEHQVVYL